MVDALLAWVFGLNPVLVWFGGGLMFLAVWVAGLWKGWRGRKSLP